MSGENQKDPRLNGGVTVWIDEAALMPETINTIKLAGGSTIWEKAIEISNSELSSALASTQRYLFGIDPASSLGDITTVSTHNEVKELTIKDLHEAIGTVRQSRDAYARQHDLFLHSWLQELVHTVGANAGHFINTTKKPENLYTFIALYEVAPEEITSSCGTMAAKLLDSNIALWEESQNMRNCIYHSYRREIEEAGYIAYHVSALHTGFKTGFTVGFETDAKCLWRIDQVRGKANSSCPDTKLHDFCVQIENTLNGRAK